MNLNYYVDELAGEIRIATASIETFEADMTLLNLNFKAEQHLTGITETQLTVRNFIANETDLTQIATSGTVIIHSIATSIEGGNYSSNGSFEVYPNPFNNLLNIKLLLNNNSQVTIEVYNLFGQKITELFDGTMKSGENTLVWDGTARGINLENGTYLIYIKQGDKVDIIKTQLIN